MDKIHANLYWIRLAPRDDADGRPRLALRLPLGSARRARALRRALGRGTLEGTTLVFEGRALLAALEACAVPEPLLAEAARFVALTTGSQGRERDAGDYAEAREVRNRVGEVYSALVDN